MYGRRGGTCQGGCWVWDAGEGKWKKERGRSWEDPGFEQGGQHSVVCVSWEDAKAYVKWLSGKTGQEYRLLSEAEWGVRGAGGHEGGVYMGGGDRGEQGELLWVRERVGWQGDGAGGVVQCERIRVARRVWECSGVGGGLLA